MRQTTACDGCHKKDGCAGCASVIDVQAHNDCSAEIGDVVRIEASTGRVLLYALLVFLFPFLPAAAAYFAVRQVTDGELLPICAAVGALALFFLLLRLTLDRRSAKRCDRRATGIVRKGGGDHNDH